MERRSASNCRKNGVNPAISAEGTTPDETGITTATCDTIRSKLRI